MRLKIADRLGLNDMTAQHVLEDPMDCDDLEMSHQKLGDLTLKLLEERNLRELQSDSSDEDDLVDTVKKKSKRQKRF